jgi:DNA-binding transcriptional MerR regulator/quercetin dioxygenase-like cupin family protein
MLSNALSKRDTSATIRRSHVSKARASKTRSSSSRRSTPAARYGFLTVGQTAKILGVSPSTLRLWESEGLVAPQRTTGRYRLYSPELLKVLKRIKYLREVQRLNMPGIRRELKEVTPKEPKEKDAAHPPIGSTTGTGKPDRTLGPQLRRMRERKKYNLAEAARRAGVSPGFLSAVERSLANASVATLQRLAMSYGTTVTELFKTAPHDRRLVTPAERRVLDVHNGVRMELLSFGAPMLQSMLFRVAPLAGSEGAYSHQGEEFIFMVSGTLEVWLDELECYVLREGDSFWFPSTHAHRWFNPGNLDAVLLWINTPPTF